MKRFLSLLLAVLVMATAILGGGGTALPASAVTSAEGIQKAVVDAYDNLLSRVNPGESAYDGTIQLLSHAMFGGGEDLYLDEDDALTGMILSSNMHRELFIDGVTAGLQNALGTNAQKQLIMGYYQWYKGLEKGTYYLADLEEPLRADAFIGHKANEENKHHFSNLTRCEQFTGSMNSFDEAMYLVVGSTQDWVILQRISSTTDTVTYRVSWQLDDNFNFDKNYSQFEGSTDLARALTWIGKLMEKGMVMKSFYWKAEVSFEITVPNTCDHATRTYRWDFNGDSVTAATGGGLTANAAASHTIQSSSEENPWYYYQLGWEIPLRHDRPWTVEFKMEKYPILLGGEDTYGQDAGTPYLVMANGCIAGVDGIKTPVDEEWKKFSYTMNYYGIREKEYGISTAQMHTYRLQNKVNADGSNMVYLIVDGEEIAPLNQHYVYTTAMEDRQETGNWFNGKDIGVRYLFNKNFAKRDYTNIEYIQIWENGEGNAPVSYITSQTVAPQPGVRGYTQHSCSQCGAVWKDSFTDALEGGIVGSWETDFTLSAAELGVNTEDARLRCTLTFGTDGAVKADWKAIDLSAFREFYHTLFVNAYYACAYGAGMTDLAQVEQACQESNGMGVSDYIYSFLDSFDINALFTPASASGTYKTEGGSLYTDLNIMGNPSDPSVPNPFTVEGNTLTWTAASYGMPDYTFLCSRK